MQGGKGRGLQGEPNSDARGHPVVGPELAAGNGAKGGEIVADVHNFLADANRTVGAEGGTGQRSPTSGGRKRDVHPEPTGRASGKYTREEPPPGHGTSWWSSGFRGRGGPGAEEIIGQCKVESGGL